MLPRMTVIAVAVALAATNAMSQKMYKHVGPDGTVVYTDRPAIAGQKEEKAKPGNVASPEATRQLYLQRRERQREFQEEAVAQRRRHQAQQLRDMKLERERLAKEAAENPGAVPQAPYRPRVRPGVTPR